MVEMVNKLFLPKAEIELTISIHRVLLFAFLIPVDENPHAHIRAGVALTKLFGVVPKAHDLVSPEERRFSSASTAPRRRKRLSFSNKGLLRLQRLKALFFSPWRLAEEIAIALENLARGNARHGRKVSGPILETHNRGARLSMTYDSWLALKAFFDSPSPGQKRIENLSTQIRLLFLFPSILDRIVRPEPRGVRAGK